MDRNTITGIILIFVIFIGFGIYNSNRTTKAFDQAVAVATADYAKGDLENARAEYINALRIKPNQPDVLSKISEINLKLGNTGNPAEVQKSDTSNLTRNNSNMPGAVPSPAVKNDITQYGVFAQSAIGENDFITLENNLIELKISLKGGRVYSARLKNYKTFDAKPLILFSGDSTVFGLNFFTSDNKAVQTNNLYFKPITEQKVYSVTSRPESVVLRLSAGEDKYIEYTYTLAPDKYVVDFNVTFKSMAGYTCI